ncbi:hypothetical protein TUM20985_11000 [Mycobacterium antarcticum]|uniref:hypothetical protein n=1 Tax=unclassified Mycolicibacterium TaxID=2636767 RepID=UPI0023A209D8|nr:MULTISPECIES: hypothetical protein [unclassified Mycolicibacterium]BDX30553.1 hypothetical protein TUM20985_11000 [Mycolicibacterium sp. TUM20985]GLP79677.1 hypothetical protein TUM20984_10970 [Mycolicibacterium sp. TUM20984]
MGLFERSGGTAVTLTPDVVSPRQTVTATITTDGPIDKVATATLEWGYDNFYRYHWAGKVDSVGAAGNDSVLTTGQVGTNYGGERDTDDWVCVTRVDLPVATSEFVGATATFKVPSWAPGSSPQIARWSARLRIERGGRDVDERGDFTVVIGTGDVDAVVEPLERFFGSGETEIDIVLDAPVYRAGDIINGQIVLNPTQDLPTGDLAVYWQRQRESHPLTRTPAEDDALDGRILQLDKKIALRAGVPVTLPFALPLPEDAAPTASAVHSSLSWFVAARLMYAGFNAHQIERVRRPITVVNAP